MKQIMVVSSLLVMCFFQFSCNVKMENQFEKFKQNASPVEATLSGWNLETEYDDWDDEHTGRAKYYLNVQYTDKQGKFHHEKVYCGSFDPGHEGYKEGQKITIWVSNTDPTDIRVKKIGGYFE